MNICSGDVNFRGSGTRRKHQRSLADQLATIIDLARDPTTQCNLTV